jgi:hypothetical protein
VRAVLFRPIEIFQCVRVEDRALRSRTVARSERRKEILVFLVQSVPALVPVTALGLQEVRPFRPRGAL